MFARALKDMKVDDTVSEGKRILESIKIKNNDIFKLNKSPYVAPHVDNI